MPVSKSSIFVMLNVSLILAITIIPTSLSFEPTIELEKLRLLNWGVSNAVDVLLNILLFVPFGISVTHYLLHQRNASVINSFLATVGICFALSYVVETFQLFQQHRFSSWIDVISNTTGGVVGFIALVLWQTWSLLPSLSAYAVLVLLITLYSHSRSSLTNWDGTFPLVIGNEGSGDRGWEGRVQEFYIADRALSASQVATLFDEGSIGSIGDSLVAWYDFTGAQRYQDKAGQLPDLVWNDKSGGPSDASGVRLDRNHWLTTTGATEALARRIQSTDEITVGIQLTALRRLQFGPARIVSYSTNPYRRNFTVAQQANDLVLRLRTPLTGPNGNNPEVVVSNVFARNRGLHLAATYSGSQVVIYVSGLRPQRVNLNVGAGVFSHFVRLRAERMLFYNVLYFCLLSAPVIILLTFILITRCASRSRSV